MTSRPLARQDIGWPWALVYGQLQIDTAYTFLYPTRTYSLTITTHRRGACGGTEFDSIDPAVRFVLQNDCMETKIGKRVTAPLVLVTAIPLALVAIALVAHPSDYVLQTAIRAAAMLGYIYIFLTCLSSAFVRELAHHFGRPYLKIHHSLATAGLTLLTIHGATVAWDSQAMTVFVPRFESPEGFLSWGGPPAYWLIWIAVTGAAARLSIGAGWRVLHWLNYIAFMLATAHALMIGSDLARPAPRWTATAMVLTVIAVFIRKRLIEAKR